MYSLNHAVAMSQRALQIQQVVLGQTSQNIAQANVPGAQRSDVRLAAGGIDNPKLDASILRANDVLAEGQALAARGQARFANERGQLLEAQLGSLLASVDDDGLGPALNALFASWRNVVSQPTDLALRQGVLDSAADLTRRLNLASKTLAAQRARLDAQVPAKVDAANLHIEAIAELNGRIAMQKASDAPSDVLEDRRGQHASALADELGIAVIYDDDGSLRPLMVDSISLVDGARPHPLTTRVDAAGMHHAVLDGSLDLTYDPKMSSGALGAVVRVRDDHMGAALASLDQFAVDLATAVNAQHRLGFGLDGIGARDLLTPVPALTDGFAYAIAVDPGRVDRPEQLAAALVAANLPAETDNARAIVALESALVADGNTQTLAASLRTLTARVATDIATWKRRGELGQAQLAAAEEVLERRVGINVQEQLALAQRARNNYQASLKTVDHVDTMLQALLAVRG